MIYLYAPGSRRTDTVGKLQAANQRCPGGRVAEWLVARGAGDADRDHAGEAPLTGREMASARSTSGCDGQLAAWLGELCQEPEVSDPPRSSGRADICDHRNAAQVAAALPPVVLPQPLAGARAGALTLAGGRRAVEQPPAHRPDRQSSGDGAPSDTATPLRDSREVCATRHGGYLDATGDEELLALLFEMGSRMLAALVDPPPKARHITVARAFNKGERGVPWLQPWGGSAATFA